MKAASGLPNLEVLDLAGQAFSGTLPAQYSFPNLLSLDLMDNDIKVRSQSTEHLPLFPVPTQGTCRSEPPVWTASARVCVVQM